MMMQIFDLTPTFEEGIHCQKCTSQETPFDLFYIVRSYNVRCSMTELLTVVKCSMDEGKCEIHLLFILISLQSSIEKSISHHSVETERRHSVTFPSQLSRLNGRYISVAIRSPFLRL